MTRKATILLLMGLLIGLYPVFKYQLPRSSEAWSHLENLRRIPSAADAANFCKMLKLFANRQHYTKYPLFYVVAKAVSIDSPFKAACYSAIVFAFLPLLVFLLAGSIFDEMEAFVSGLAVVVASAFVYTMNFFSGGEPLAVAFLLAGFTLHLRRGPFAALPLYLGIVFFHPFTSLLLWIVLVLFPFFSEPDSTRSALAHGLCTVLFSLALSGWFLVQISANLPLGSFIVSNLDAGTLWMFFIAVTGGSLAAQAMRPRVDLLRRATNLAVTWLEVNLPVLIVALEIFFLVLFIVVGVPGTEQIVRPSTALFYLPLLAAVALVGFRGQKAEPFTASLVTSELVLFLAGIVAFPRGIPIYRLAPYGAIGLSLMLAPCARRRRCRLLLPLVLGGLAATTYPGPSFYFGFDEQYYPSESAAVCKIQNVTAGACLLSDVRMEDFLRYETGLQAIAAAGQPIALTQGCVAVITQHMRQYGFYPAGHEWFRLPMSLDLSDLDLGSTRIYDNRRVQILVSAVPRIDLGVPSA